MSWADICREMVQCRACQLHTAKDNGGRPVIGSGTMRSGIVFIGEAPGRTENETGLPFTGPAGKILDDMFKKLEINRNDVYITNVVKCRPPENRVPTTEEINCCNIHLQAQLIHLKPKMVVCLGATAAGAIIGRKFSMTRQHGKIFEDNGVLIAAAYHPAAVLYNPTLERLLFNDLYAIMEYYKEHKQ